MNPYKIIISPLNNIDANFEKLGDIIVKNFKDQKDYYIKHDFHPINLENFKAGKEVKKIDTPDIKEFKELFSETELEDLNNLFQAFSSDEVS